MPRSSRFRPAWMAIAIVFFSSILYLLTFSEKTPPKSNDTILTTPVVSPTFASHKNAQENENCLQCHGQSKYHYINNESKKLVTKKMFSELILNRTLFYESNHREFKCIDCHSEDYGTFPHAGNLRMEAKPTCLDCHGGDEKYVKFNFENIEKEFMESIHSQKHQKDFTCWMCHNPHSYKITARTNHDIKETIAYDNAICLGCHGNLSNYQILTDKINPDLITKHEWLPNQSLHFRSVRCIECHTKKMNDKTLVAHKILPKSEAVKKCAECHSNNSVLMAALYKYQLKEVRSAKGFFSSIFDSDSYAIGANRNFYLNMISLIIFGFVIIGIIIHAILRIIK